MSKATQTEVQRKLQAMVAERLAWLRSTNQEDKKFHARLRLFNNQVYGYMDKHFAQLPVDFILEIFTHLGGAPNLVYDDNGLFAVSGNGYQPVVTGKDKIDGTIHTFVEKRMWKPTIRKAVRYYLTKYMQPPKPTTKKRRRYGTAKRV
jgi:hypothetical protein